MRTTEVVLEGIGPGLLRTPDADAPVRGGLVALHGAALPERDQPLFEHLARTLTPAGYAVLSYDRRAPTDSGDTPLAVQAEDALTALEALCAEVEAPVGLYGFSQGAWAVALAAAGSPLVAWLAVVGCSGVSPAVQMQYYTDELLRRAGYGDGDRAQLRELRLAMEDILRGGGDRGATSALLAAAVRQPWFPMAYLHAALPAPDESWHDMDYDPQPTFAAISCPTLAMYGADEECVPAEASKAAWRRAAALAGNPDLTLVDLPGCGHFPASPDVAQDLSAVTVADISPAYTEALADWFGHR